ncbi:hypothetical protein SH139x_002996 [Planctomycetaceae bacterium SH139]
MVTAPVEMFPPAFPNLAAQLPKLAPLKGEGRDGFLPAEGGLAIDKAIKDVPPYPIRQAINSNESVSSFHPSKPSCQKQRVMTNGLDQGPADP